MKYRLMKEDKHSFHMMHPDGSQFRIAKSGIDHHLVKKIRGYADGGQVEDEEGEAPAQVGDDGAPAAPQGDLASVLGVAGQKPGPQATSVPPVPEIAPGIPETTDQGPAVSPGEAEANRDFMKQRTDFYKNQPGLYPTEAAAQKQAEADLIQMKESESAKEAAGEQANQKKIQDDIDYNMKAAKLGLPLREVPAAAQQAADQQQQPPVSLQQQAQRLAQMSPSQAAQQQGPGIDIYGQYQDVLRQQTAGIQGMAQAKMAEAQSTSQAYKDFIDKQTQSAQDYKARKDAILAENDKLAQSIQAGQVDPHRFWNNTSTGNKVLASIGIMLGGLGAGMTRGRNIALDQLNNSINQDIDAQKSNLGKQQNLYSMNLQKYRSVEDAENATRLQMNTVLQGLIAQAAAQSGSQQAQANAQLMIGQLKAQQLPILQQLAASQTQARLYGAGGQEGGVALGSEPMQLLMDPKYRETRVPLPGVGRVYAANDKESAQAQNQMEATAGTVTSLVKQLDQLGPSAMVPGTQDYLKAQALRGQLAVSLPRLSGLKRINETEIHELQKAVSNPSKFSGMMNGGMLNQAFFKNVQQELEDNRRQNLIGYGGTARLRTLSPAMASNR